MVSPQSILLRPMAEVKTSYPKDKINILLLEGIHPSAIDIFRREGYVNIESMPGAAGSDALGEKLKGVHVLGIRSKTQVTKASLANAGKLLTVGAFCIGTNQIDMNECTRLGVAVFNSPFSNTRSVAELVIAEVILLLRRAVDKNRNLHNGHWEKSSAGSFEARGKTLGIIGYGHIGSQVSVLAESMGMQVVYYDIDPKLPLGNARTAKSLGDLLKQSDVVTIHVPGLPSTKNMLDAKHIGEMKKGAILINCARGDLVVEEDARRALLDGQLGGYAGDVFRYEPASNDEPFKSVFQNLPNVFLTPHIGGSTVEAQESIGADVANKMMNYLNTGSTVGSLTVPDLYLPVQQGTHRILHIHKNQPGVMSEMNKIFSDLSVNILGQYLKTNPQIGYAVMDIDNKTSPEVLDALRQVKHTIRVRSLY
jgi:D-3-phosphoglycerate dehydrogenase / 2-oxoglutarate reductase